MSVTPAAPSQTALLIREYLSRILAVDQVVELRALGVIRPGESPWAVVSGFFDKIELLAEAAAGLDGFARGVYFTLNPLRPEVLSRAPNRLEHHAQAATDADVLSRRWLPLDFDPVRPKDTNATEDELAAALERADLVWRERRRRGWPEPVPGLSGNGAHLLFPLEDVPVNDGGLVRNALHKLSLEFSDDRVCLDKAVHNPSRIWKTYGTTARKAPHTAERPHRRAAVLGRPAA